MLVQCIDVFEQYLTITI